MLGLGVRPRALSGSPSTPQRSSQTLFLGPAAPTLDTFTLDVGLGVSLVHFMGSLRFSISGWRH